MSLGHTLADGDEGTKKQAAEALGAYLFVLMEYDRPRALGSRHSLMGIRSVSVGRGQIREALRTNPTTAAGRATLGTETDGAAPSDAAPSGAPPSDVPDVAVDLTLRVPDRRMSSRHALLTLVRGEWVLEDSASRNGTRVNGERVDKATLVDGDRIEMGRSLFLFRDGLPRTPDVDFDGARLPTPPLTLNPALELQFQKLERIASAKTLAILIEGESGTGKEVLARRIAEWSGRSGRFVAVNCGALPENLVESELFGATRGAFSGATNDRTGLVRSADKGCLFLDEIAELPLSSQATLLRVLQEHEVLPVGGTKPIPVDLQVLAATHQDLERRVQKGEFRQDLFARISGFRCRLPTLKERKEDLGLLIGTLLKRDPNARPDTRFTSTALRELLNHNWPRNVRELSHALAAATLLTEDGLIDVQHLPKDIAPDGSSDGANAAPAAPLTDEQVEQRDELVALLEKHKGNVSAIARELGKARMQVQRWLKRYNLDAESYRD